MSEPAVLNPKLYFELRRRFGMVKISNEGQQRVVAMHVNPFTRKKEPVVEDPGEHYRICCPRCKETRFRLYISYLWNTEDPNGQIANRHLIHCFNEGCDLRDFAEELKDYVAGPPRKQPSFETDRTSWFKEVTLPGDCVPLASLPPNHVAIKYIESRKFDPKELTDKWGLKFCKDCENPMVRGRIVIPIYWNEQLVGWQARSLDPNEKTMKYATMPGFSKSKMLFNGDRAKKHKFGVVVEGVFDAFRVGDRAVALLGKSLSHTQQQLVLSWWGSGSLCVMLDPDAIEDAERITTLLNPNAYRMGVFSLTLPEDTDPADMDREVLERMIADHARSRGIPLIAL